MSERIRTVSGGLVVWLQLLEIPGVPLHLGRNFSFATTGLMVMETVEKFPCFGCVVI